MLLYLPLAHNYGRLLHLSAAYIGFTIAFLPDPMQRGSGTAARASDALSERAARLREDLRRRRPRGSRRRPACAASSSTGRFGVGREVSRAATGQAARAGRRSRWKHRLADRLVYSKVKERLGGRLRIANAGGAPLSREIAEFFHSLDILILEGYGLSEVTTAATVNRPEAFKFGTVGKPMPGVELEIDAGRGDPDPLEHGLRRVLPRPGGDREALDERGLGPHRRHRPARRGRLPRDHRPQEGHHRHRRRQERRPAEPRERAEDPRDRLAGARHRRSPAVHRRR